MWSTSIQTWAVVRNLGRSPALVFLCGWFNPAPDFCFQFEEFPCRQFMYISGGICLHIELVYFWFYIFSIFT